MKVTTVVLAYNSKDYISDCLSSLLDQKVGTHSHQVVVVDNDSSDGTTELVQKKFPQVKLLRNPTNMGYSGGNNTGIIYGLDTKSDFVWIINPDVTVSPDSLQKFIDGASHHVGDGVFGCKIYFAPGEEFHKDRYSEKDLGKVFWYAGGLMDWKNLIGSHRGVDEVDSGQFDRDLETDYVTGACIFIKRRVLEDVGLLDPKYFLYYEENDFCQRARRAGFKCLFLYGPQAWHKNAKATGIGSPLQDYFISRNRMMFGMRFAPAYTKFSLVRESLNLYQTGRPWQKKGIIDFYKGSMGSGSFELS